MIKYKLLQKLPDEAKSSVLPKGCYECRKNKSIIKSHSIPKHVLENISHEGYVCDVSAVLPHPSQDEDEDRLGPRKAGIFNLICQQCDSELFDDYEGWLSSKNLNYNNKQRLAQQIAMKNYLHRIDKARVDINVFQLLNDSSDNFICDVTNLKQDELDFWKLYLNAKNISYDCFYFKILEYTVPIAYQNIITLRKGLANEVINSNDDEIMEDLHVCIWPLKNNKSIVMMLRNQNHKKYDQFCEDFQKLDEDEKLETIHKMVWLYSYDMYISPKINQSILDSLKSTVVANSMLSEEMLSNKYDYDLTKSRDLLNLLAYSSRHQ